MRVPLTMSCNNVMLNIISTLYAGYIVSVHRMVVGNRPVDPVLWYGLGRPVITSEIGHRSVFVLLGWRFVFGIIMKRDGRETTSQMPSRLWE